MDFDSSLLVTDETEGCISKKLTKKKLSMPHSTSMVDFDGDCLSDLFITVTDQVTGKTFYEIYLRREKEYEDEKETLMDDYLLTQNETLPMDR